jgi:hypothetical protein
MNEFELTMTLSEFGIDTPDRCKACPKLGSLASKLSLSQENKNFLTVSTEESVLFANIRSQLHAQFVEHYPTATEEQATIALDNSMAHFLASDRYSSFLRKSGEMIEEDDAAITDTLNEMVNLVDMCPPQGCDSTPHN